MTVFEIHKEKLGLVDYVKSFLATFLPNNQDPWNHYTIYAVAIRGICSRYSWVIQLVVDSIFWFCLYLIMNWKWNIVKFAFQQNLSFSIGFLRNFTIYNHRRFRNSITQKSIVITKYKYFQKIVRIKMKFVSVWNYTWVLNLEDPQDVG